MTTIDESEKKGILDTVHILPGLKPLHLQRLLMVSRSLGSTLDLQEVLRMVLSAAAELTESAGASIMLVEPNGNELRFAASSFGLSQLKDLVVPIEGSMAGQVVKENTYIVIEDAENDERHYANTSQTVGIEISNLIGVPLRDRGQVIGVLETFNKKNGGRYTSYDQSVAQALASQAAISIVNARLFSQSDAIAETMHEIKTPLMAMTAATEMLEMDSISEQQRTHLLKTIKRETRRLTRMTQDFLTLSRLDSGRFELDLVPINPYELAQAAIDTLIAQAENRGIGIRLFADSKENHRINGDVSRLQQVLINLISNAIKYNKANGKVAINIFKKSEELWISVMDTGHGISEEDIKHLFERFYRIESIGEPTEGTGLGLSIVKKLVEAHEGRIEVESELGKGSAFHCIFPLLESAD
ncbi:MAG: GAF domain-containing sensor histidine kinase [Chloroflexota bacterium]